MSAETEIKESSEEVKAEDSSFSWKRLVKICLTFLICAFIFIVTCSGGLKSGIRGVILGACILLGLFAVKSFYKDSINWKKRVGYFALAGILSGLLAAIIIWLLEMQLLMPSLSYNPHAQTTKGLFWTCPLYGLFMSGGFALAFNLSSKIRYFIVWAGAAFVNALGLEELAVNSDLATYIWGVLKICFFYYPRGLINCFMFVLLWCLCAESICRKKQVEKKTKWQKAITVFCIIVYLFFILVICTLFSSGFERHSVYLANEKFRIKLKNTVFNEELTGVIIMKGKREYYDCEKKAFCKLPADIKITDYLNLKSKNRELRIDDGIDSMEIERLKNGKVIAHMTRFIDCRYPFVVNDSVYYRKYGDIFRLSPPNYDTPVLIMEDAPRNCYVSPNEKFITYCGGAYRYTSSVLCVMNIKSKKVKSLKTVSGRFIDVYWFKDMKDFREILAEQKGIKK